MLAAALLLATTYAWNWSMTSDAFGQISQGKISILHQATMGLGPDLETPPAWATEVTLPHRTEDSRAGFAHYRLSVNVDRAPSYEMRMALCVPRWSANASVWIDGQRLLNQEQGRLDFKALFRPALVPLPIDLSQGSHRIDIRLRTVMGTFPGLSEVWFGPYDLLARECGDLQDLLVGMRIGGILLMLFIALVAVCVYASQRDGLSLGFVLASVSWCLHTSVALGWLGGLDGRSWITWFMVTRPMTGFAGLYVALRLIGSERRSLDLGLLALIVLAYVALALLPMDQWQTWLMGVGLVLVPITLVMAFCLLWHAAAKSRYLSDFTFALSMFFGVGANALDVARVKGWLPYSVLSMTYWLAPMLALAIGLLVIERLVRYLHYKKEAAAQLKRELAEQRIQLAVYNEEIQKQRETILLTEERQRLVRDMHDGLGSQLVSASALLKSSHSEDAMSIELSELIDHALLDLRSMLDVFSSHKYHVDGEEQDTVSVLLGMLRHRLAPVFRSQTIEFDWQAEPLPHDFVQGDRERLQLLRLLQEACTNIIKHAQAQHVSMRTYVTSSAIVFEVHDDGKGIEASKGTSQRTGHGMASMAARATRLGAQLVIDSSAEGTCIRVIFQR
jgi:signal transduction histidine kinase